MAWVLEITQHFPIALMSAIPGPGQMAAAHLIPKF